MTGLSSVITDKLAPKISSSLSKGVSKIKSIFTSSADDVANSTGRLKPNLQLFGDKLDDGVVKDINGIKSVKTPYGQATQDISNDALDVRMHIESGGDLFRGGTFGRSNTTEAQFWAIENPLNPGYSNKYGVDFESLDYIIKGKLKPGTNFITRTAPGLGENMGGAIEVVTPPNSVKVEYFYMLGEKR